MKKQEIWDFWAKFYDRLWLQRVSLQPTRALVCEKILALRHLPAFSDTSDKGAKEVSQLKILDMGCGTGQLYGDLIQQLGKERFYYLGVDSSGAMLEQALQKFPQADFFQSDVMGVMPDQEFFDLIVCSHSFPYFPDGKAALERMAMMLKPGGQLLLSQACTNNRYDAIILKLTEFTTSKAIYRSSQEMTELAAPLFRKLQSFRISEKFLVPSLLLFQWVK
ncbi:class I SAM-dependent DNA methyltransferase [Candidatus Electrothrix sp.]|uniref:class I SAM-dependent DNA methyltransferase n=2 Tax=Candidatus Electrothrix sp. TaxID=2170559 RepID=UPI004055AB19